jgi:hypothetical protein
MRIKIGRGYLPGISAYAATNAKGGNYAFYENVQKIIHTVIKPVMLLLMDDFSATIILEDLVKLRELQQE